MGYLLGISPYRAILRWLKQLGALHPKGTTVFPMKKKEANTCLPRNHNFRCEKLFVPNGVVSIPLGICEKKNSKQKTTNTSNGDVQSKSEKMWKVTTKLTNHLSQQNPSNFCCVLVSPHLLPFTRPFRNGRSRSSHGFPCLRNEGATLRKEDAGAEVLA